MSAPIVSVRQRACFLLRAAGDDGRLEASLGKLQGLCQGEEILEAKAEQDAAREVVKGVPPIAIGVPAAAGSTDAVGVPDAEVEVTCPITKVKKKKKHGRDMASALQLGTMPTPPPSPRPHSQGHGAHGHRGNATGHHGHPEQHGQHELDPDHPDFDHEHHNSVKEAEREAEKKRKKGERLLQKKFDEAKRQEQRREDAKTMYRKRAKYIDDELKPLLERLTSTVSMTSARPDNPVPLMIEVLAEIGGIHPNKYKNSGPEQRLNREIKDLEHEIEKMEKELQLPSEYDAESVGSDPGSP